MTHRWSVVEVQALWGLCKLTKCWNGALAAAYGNNLGVYLLFAPPERAFESRAMKMGPLAC